MPQLADPEVPMRWSEIEERQPRLARLGAKRLIDPGVLLVGTTRRDGTPRISAVEPFILDGEMMLAMMWGSTKAADLQRDPRVLLHSIVSGREEPEGEFMVRGIARIEHDPAVQRRYAAAVAANLGWNPTPGRFHLFRIDIDSVAFVRYDPTGDQHVSMWPSSREFVRRATSATSVGDPEDEVAVLVG